MKKLFLSLSILLFALPILSLVHFHRGGGDKLLTSQPNSPSVDPLTSNELWGASLATVGNNAQLVESEKVKSNRRDFLDFFFQNQKAITEYFQSLVANSDFLKNNTPLRIFVRYIVDPTTRQTVPFPTDWRAKDTTIFSSRSFREAGTTSSPTTYGSWINFLRTATTQNLNEDQADTNNFFWDQFFEAYLYFVGLSKTTLYSNESFLLFLQNITVAYVQIWSRNIVSVQISSFLQYLPGVNLTSVGEDKIDLNAILNLDPNTLTLKDLNPEITLAIRNYRGYRRLALEKVKRFRLNTPYEKDIKLLKDLVEKKDFWTTLDTVLNNDLGIKFLFLNGTEYNLENLILHFSYDPKLTTLNFTYATNQLAEELTKLIFANKRGIQYGIDTPDKLQKLFDDTKNRLLSSLQTALKTLQKVDPTVTQLPINGQKHDLNQLLQATNKLLNPNLETEEKGIVAQIKALFSKSIYGLEIAKATNQLKKYKEILPFLNKLATNQKRTSLKINDQDYSFTSLLTDAKKQFADFAKDSLDELQKLVEGKITLSQLKTIYQESLPSSKKSTNQNLAIGLGTAGGVVALAGAGGFAYWFLKIRKP